MLFTIRQLRFLVACPFLCFHELERYAIDCESQLPTTLLKHSIEDKNNTTMTGLCDIFNDLLTGEMFNKVAHPIQSPHSAAVKAHVSKIGMDATTKPSQATSLGINGTWKMLLKFLP